ncbi:hypothetical protein BPOR_0177g00160 [Botrytis porri]|uniref:Uncharacterized protein n=1 Tax=Botrytis porri TaxID=87229 RepID=A0A4Z1KUT3_9HELO|nr:hypothetical protein BPOR_0177g00160 [Botrytis porri]
MDDDHLSAVLAIILISDAYEEYDLIKGDPKGWRVNGQRAYMMLRGGGHPADHYPCKVAFAKQK